MLVPSELFQPLVSQVGLLLSFCQVALLLFRCVVNRHWLQLTLFGLSLFCAKDAPCLPLQYGPCFTPVALGCQAATRNHYTILLMPEQQSQVSGPILLMPEQPE